MTVTDDASLIDLDLVHSWLRESYWAKNRDRDTQRRANAGSMLFGAFDEEEQVGFARVVTDRATFAWICDVIVSPEARGKGVGKALMDAITAHPELEGVRLLLATRDAHSLYEKYDFKPLPEPEMWMQRRFVIPPLD